MLKFRRRAYDVEAVLFTREAVAAGQVPAEVELLKEGAGKVIGGLFAVPRGVATVNNIVRLGEYLVRDKTGQLSVTAKEPFEAKFEAAPEEAPAA